jgi:hypothetical protein
MLAAFIPPIDQSSLPEINRKKIWLAKAAFANLSGEWVTTLVVPNASLVNGDRINEDRTYAYVIRRRLMEEFINILSDWNTNNSPGVLKGMWGFSGPANPTSWPHICVSYPTFRRWLESILCSQVYRLESHTTCRLEKGGCRSILR